MPALMKPTVQEERLQVAARHCGLKLVLDRYKTAATGTKRYFLRPIWDARRALLVLPDGGRMLVRIAEGRRSAASRD
jgi:hypothetical protein